MTFPLIFEELISMSCCSSVGQETQACLAKGRAWKLSAQSPSLVVGSDRHHQRKLGTSRLWQKVSLRLGLAVLCGGKVWGHRLRQTQMS